MAGGVGNVGVKDVDGSSDHGGGGRGADAGSGLGMGGGGGVRCFSRMCRHVVVDGRFALEALMS